MKSKIIALILCIILISIIPTTMGNNQEIDDGKGEKSYYEDFNEQIGERTEITIHDGHRYVMERSCYDPRTLFFDDKLPILGDRGNGNVLWEYVDESTLPIVSMCDNGNYTWVGQDGSNGRFQLFYTNGSGVPEWEYVPPDNPHEPYHVIYPKIDAAAKGTVLAGFAYNPWVSQFDFPPRLYKWNINNSQPSWSFEIPPDFYDRSCQVRVSDDGNRIVLASSNASQRIMKTWIFSQDSNIPLLIYQINITHDYCGLDLLDISDDGTLILLVNSNDAIVVDTTIPNIRYFEPVLYPAALSGDGTILAHDNYIVGQGHELHVLQWNETVHDYVELWHKLYTPPEWFICVNLHIMEISADSSTIMVGVTGGLINGIFTLTKLVAFDVETSEILWEYNTPPGAGIYSDYIAEIQLSEDGSRGIVGHWGNSINSHPELKVFARQNPTPIFTIDSPGSMYSVDISPNGGYVVGGCKMVHAMEWGSGGVTYAIDLTENEDDNDPPIVEISKPLNALYIRNIKRLPLRKPLIIGDLDIEVEASDEQSGIDKVEFYIDDELKETDITEPYSWTWDERAPLRFRHTIKVIAYDEAGNYATSEISVRKFF